MIAALLIAGMISAQDFEVPAKTITWEELSPAIFDMGWTLPEHRPEGRDLLAEMRRLVSGTFEVEDASGPHRVAFGDLVAEAYALDPAARERWYADLGARAPQLVQDWGQGLTELFFDDYLRSDRWNPDEDDPRDGILVADEWKLERKSGPWAKLRVAPQVEQAAALFRADLATIKEIENDYRRYPENVGSDYEEIYPLENQHFRGVDPAGRPFAALTIQFRCDLPFPFSDYTCRLHMLNRFDDDGTPRTDIYSTSKDFYWLAGRDVFLPVEDSEGSWVAYLVVRHFGFDLDGVPDKPGHRLGALRASLGNLKRNSEARFLTRVADTRPAPEAFTTFPVWGSSR